MQKLKRFIFNGILLTAVSLIMRTVAVSFQVYLSNKIGATAMGIFSLITTVYGFAITLATSGIQLATTRMVAEAMGEFKTDCEKSIKCILGKCIGYALFFSILSATVLFISAPVISVKLLRDARTLVPLRLLVISLVPIALASVFNGYFVAVRRVWKNAVCQILGEAIRIFACIILLSLMLSNDVQDACIAVILGGVIAELSSFAFQGTLFLIERKKFKSARIDCKANREFKSKLLHIALPVAFSAYVRSALVTIEHLLIPRGLEKSGNSREASLAAYGTLQSMVFPLILFPAAISSSFAGLLIPEIAESSAAGDSEEILKTVDRVFEAVLSFAIGVAGIIICFSKELGNTVYPGTDAAKFILYTAPLIPVMYLDTSVDSMLKGLGQQVYHMTINIIDSFLSVILVIILIPRFGILGYVITVYFTELINATLSITRLLTVIKIKPHLFSWVLRPLMCIAFSTALARYILRLNGAFSGKVSDLVLYIASAALTYTASLLLLKLPKILKKIKP